MRYAYIEPSAWVKRYYREAGTDLTNYLFALQVALEVHSRLHRQGDTLLLFAADRRLLRAAQAESLTSFNPETGSRSQLETLLS